MPKPRHIILLGLGLLLLPLASTARTVIKPALTSSQSASIGKPAPKVKLVDINNTPIQLGGVSKHAQVILSVVSLDNKATRIEAHRFNLMATKYQNAQFIIISQQPANELRQFAHQYKLNNVVLISDSNNKNKSAAEQHSLYIIGKNGKLLNEQVVSQPNTLVNFQPIIKALSPETIRMPSRYGR